MQLHAIQLNEMQAEVDEQSDMLDWQKAGQAVRNARQLQLQEMQLQQQLEQLEERRARLTSSPSN